MIENNLNPNLYQNIFSGAIIQQVVTRTVDALEEITGSIKVRINHLSIPKIRFSYLSWLFNQHETPPKQQLLHNHPPTAFRGDPLNQRYSDLTGM